MGYRPATYLAGAPGITSKRIGDAFVKDVKNDDITVYGIGFTTPSVTGLDSQFDGDYASTFPDAKTEPLGTSAEVIIRDPQAMALYLDTTQEIAAAGGVANNTYQYSQEKPVSFTAAQTLAFQSEQG